MSGQMSAANSLTCSMEQVFQTTEKYPAICSVDLAAPEDADSANHLIDEAIQESAAGSIVSLQWLPQNPANVGQAANPTADHDNRSPPLTDFEWKELIMPGTQLYRRWSDQVDKLAIELRKLQDKNIAILWTPYPDPNGKQYWWAGHAGIHGSAALYRMLFDRLVKNNGIHNLIWVWRVVPGGFGPGGNGSYTDFFPGFLYVDALELSVSRNQPRFRSDIFLQGFAVGKAIGLAIDGPLPDPAFFARETNWTWFLLAPLSSAAANDAITSQALRTLYGDHRILTR